MRLLDEIKDLGQDYEWYPTTEEIVKVVAKDIEAKLCGVHGRPENSILDIGAGNGGFIEKFKKCMDSNYRTRWSYYGIEKSTRLVEEWPDELLFLGADFWNTTLIDKKVSCIFCNPPYSEFEAWLERIIQNGNASYAYFVVPTRWKNSEKIKNAIKFRGLSVQETVLGTFTFDHAERAARAVVDVICVPLWAKKTAFDAWFDSTFQFDKQEIKYAFEDDEQISKDGQLVTRGDTSERLVQCYNNDMNRIYNSYQAITKVDAGILAELGVDVVQIKKCLEKRLAGLKSVYWDLLFKQFDVILERVTSYARQRYMFRLSQLTSLDFTPQNIITVVSKLIKDSTKTFDEQLVFYYESLFDVDSIHLYKSNARMTADDWRYIKDDYKKSPWKYRCNTVAVTHYTLDYRIVYKCSAVEYNQFSGGDYKLNARGVDFLRDTLIIANNLGFKCNFKQLPENHYSRPQTKLELWSSKDLVTDSGEVLVHVRVYQNGNMHLKYNKNFMRKLNTEAGRLLGWLKSEKEAKENTGATADDWKCNFRVDMSFKRALGCE